MIPKEFLGAFKAGHRVGTRDFIDEELSIRLLKQYQRTGCEKSRDALEFLTRFNNEFHKNVFYKEGLNVLHKTPELRADCSKKDQARKKCVFQNLMIDRKLTDPK